MYFMPRFLRYYNSPVDIDARMKRERDESRWEISALYDKRNANADAFMRAGDAHSRFAIITLHANGPIVD